MADVLVPALCFSEGTEDTRDSGADLDLWGGLGGLSGQPYY